MGFMGMSIPKTRGKFLGRIVSNKEICGQHYRMVVGLDAFGPTRPGQFVQLQCRGLAEQITSREILWRPEQPLRLGQPELADREPFLRRPLSLGGRRDTDGGVELDIIYRTIGAGTRWLARSPAGTQLSLIGPLGNAFAISGEKPLAVVIGGGVGIPPMIYLAEALAEARKQVVAFSGARTAAMLPLTFMPDIDVSPQGHPTPCVEEFDEYRIPSVIATDDGTAGFAGTASEAFRNWLNAHGPAAQETVVYCCGPEPLMQAVGDICVSREIQCQLALERHMACGMGTCQSCVCKIRATNEQGWAYKLCCTDGPVFDAGEIVW
jgi:dihydroorotate dehydrogenase electron transfer subunit